MMKNFLHRVIKMFLIQVSQKRPKASSREEVLIKIFRATNLMHHISPFLMSVNTFAEHVLSISADLCTRQCSSQIFLAVRTQGLEDFKINHLDGAKDSTIHLRWTTYHTNQLKNISPLPSCIFCAMS